MDMVLLSITTLSLAAAAGFGFLSWRIGREERERERARIAALADAMSPFLPETPLREEVAVGSVFERSTEGLRGRPVIRVAAGVLMLVIIGGGALISSWTSGAADSKTTAPLELMTMRYQRQGTTLTVSGLVKNPSSGLTVNDVAAVVFAFNRNGAFVSSGRAQLDFNVLAPGDESPFIVNVPNVADVARYRVTFRSGDTVVRHIDRRSNRVQLARQ
jgi:hypothetical protein